MTMAENYESPWGGACDGSSPAPATPDPGSPQVADLRVPRPARETIREIRERAGVPPSEIAENPSYNEIMLALTKERFFDPKYFINMNNNLGAIRQEQTAINAYISIMMQDIYNMQERINALLAARAALGYGKIPEKTATSQNPNR